MIDEKKLSRRYAVRRLTAEDAEAVYALCHENSIFYRHHPPMVTVESVLEDMNALPPNKTFADKYFVGFWNGEALIAVLDLIDGYPRADIAYIGFFMTDVSAQGKGVGSAMISECAAYLKSRGFRGIRLAVDKGNPQSLHFWSKNHFSVDETYVGKLIVMDRKL